MLGKNKTYFFLGLPHVETKLTQEFNLVAKPMNKVVIVVGKYLLIFRLIRRTMVDQKWATETQQIRLVSAEYSTVACPSSALTYGFSQEFHSAVAGHELVSRINSKWQWTLPLSSHCLICSELISQQDKLTFTDSNFTWLIDSSHKVIFSNRLTEMCFLCRPICQSKCLSLNNVFTLS